MGNKLNWRTFSLEYDASTKEGVKTNQFWFVGGGGLLYRLADMNPDWRFICLDLRGHGDSPSFSPPHNLEACAVDVLYAPLDMWVSLTPTAILGHSFSGKVALTYLQKCMEQSHSLPNQVWILDSLPGSGATDYASRDLTKSIETILPIVKRIPLPIRSKAQLVQDLQSNGVALGEAQWLTTNLRLISKSPELYEWKMNVDVIEQLFHSFLATDLWPFVENPPATKGKEVELHFVRASNNNMWTPELLDRLDALQDKLVFHHLLEKSGHWMHIDNPVGLMDIIHANTIRMKKDSAPSN